MNAFTRKNIIRILKLPCNFLTQTIFRIFAQSLDEYSGNVRETFSYYRKSFQKTLTISEKFWKNFREPWEIFGKTSKVFENVFSEFFCSLGKSSEIDIFTSKNVRDHQREYGKCATQSQSRMWLRMYFTSSVFQSNNRLLSIK